MYLSFFLFPSLSNSHCVCLYLIHISPFSLRFFLILCASLFYCLWYVCVCLSFLSHSICIHLSFTLCLSFSFTFFVSAYVSLLSLSLCISLFLSLSLYACVSLSCFLLIFASYVIVLFPDQISLVNLHTLVFWVILTLANLFFILHKPLHHIHPHLCFLLGSHFFFFFYWVWTWGKFF